MLANPVTYSTVDISIPLDARQHHVTYPFLDVSATHEATQRPRPTTETSRATQPSIKMLGRDVAKPVHPTTDTNAPDEALYALPDNNWKSSSDSDGETDSDDLFDPVNFSANSSTPVASIRESNNNPFNGAPTSTMSNADLRKSTIDQNQALRSPYFLPLRHDEATVAPTPHEIYTQSQIDENSRTQIKTVYPPNNGVHQPDNVISSENNFGGELPHWPEQLYQQRQVPQQECLFPNDIDPSYHGRGHGFITRMPHQYSPAYTNDCQPSQPVQSRRVIPPTDPNYVFPQNPNAEHTLQQNVLQQNDPVIPPKHQLVMPSGHPAPSTYSSDVVHHNNHIPIVTCNSFCYSTDLPPTDSVYRQIPMKPAANLTKEGPVRFDPPPYEHVVRESQNEHLANTSSHVSASNTSNQRRQNGLSPPFSHNQNELNHNPQSLLPPNTNLSVESSNGLTNNYFIFDSNVTMPGDQKALNKNSRPGNQDTNRRSTENITSLDSNPVSTQNPSLASVESQFSSLVITADTLPKTNNPHWGDDFIPRDADKTGEILSKISSGVPTVCISGGPGNGKTTFAKHVGEQALRLYHVAAVYFISFETIFEESASLGLVGNENNAVKYKNLVASAILKGMTDKNYEDPPTALERFCRNISPESRVLFILDNVETMSGSIAQDAFCTVMKSMTETRSKNVHLLLTTRDSTICSAMMITARLKGPLKIDLKTFNEKESRRFLLKFIAEEVKEKVSEATFDKHIGLILKNCQGNALGLKLCASMMEDYIFEDSPADFFEDVFGCINDLANGNLTKIIQSSFDKLQEDERQFMKAMSTFPGPFNNNHAQQMSSIASKKVLTMLNKMKDKSLISRHNEEASKFNIHPFIRDYCRGLEAYGQYRLRFIEITLKNLVHISEKSHKKNQFSDARSEFLVDSLHFESALALIETEQGEGDIRQRLRDILQNFADPWILAYVLNFLNHVFYSSQFDLLISFIDTLLELIPKEPGNGLDVHVIVKSHKIRGAESEARKKVDEWILEASHDLQDATNFAKAHFLYAQGLHVAKNKKFKKDQKKATEFFKKAAELIRFPKNDSEKVILHYSQMSIAIQQTKCKDSKSNDAGKKELEELLTEVKSEWGTHPIVMEVQKSIADMYFTDGTRKNQRRVNYDKSSKQKGKKEKASNKASEEANLALQESQAAFMLAERHYDGASKMMMDMNVNQEQSRVRLLKNRASCMLYVHIPEKGEKRVEALRLVEKDYQEARRLICECKPCPLKYEVWCAIAVFYECLALTEDNAGDRRQTMAEAIKFAKEAQDMHEYEKIELEKGRQNGQSNIEAIVNHQWSSAAQGLFPGLTERSSSAELSLTSLDGVPLFENEECFVIQGLQKKGDGAK